MAGRGAGPESGFRAGGRFYDYYDLPMAGFFSLAGLSRSLCRASVIWLENPQIAARG